MKKLGILKLVLLVSLLSFTIFSCNENPMDDDFTLKNQSNIIEEKTLIILGEQYPNPYSVSNMLNAYQYLKNNGENIGNLNITTTDLYVRFLPQDTTQYNFLNNDTTLILFDYPLDYEIEKFGDYYQDPNIEEGNYTWLYTTVPINYQFNPLIEYEILDSCYIAQDDNENTITDNDKLEQTSFKLLGLDSIFINHNELNTKGWFSSKKPEGKFKFLQKDSTLYTPIKGYDLNLSETNNCWKLANINNSAYEYYNFCSDNEILTPPLFLKIWMTNTTNKGCAPMLPRITHPIGRDSNCELADFFINIIYGLPATLFIHKGANWIRADILHDLMKEGIVSPNDVFDCLTPLVTTQNKLKEALQEKSPANHNIIETRFDTLNNN